MPPKGAKKDDVVLRTYQRRVRNAQRKVTEANENIKRLKLNKGAKMFAEFQESWPFASFNQVGPAPCPPPFFCPQKSTRPGLQQCQAQGKVFCL